MAFIKFKELTQYFDFFQEIPLDKLPDYVYDYVSKGEKIKAVYCTYRDKCAFTDRKIIIFDRRGILGKCKKIHFFPYHNISSSAIQYNDKKVTLLFSMDSGYQVRLDFVKMDSQAKAKIREIYFELIEEIDKVSVEK